jgi:hypothetical protein
MAATLELIADGDTAQRIAEYHLGLVDYCDEVEQIGYGRDRTAYVAYWQDTVYKIGVDSANHAEYRVLSEHAGEDMIPPVELFDVTVDAERGPVAMPVIAMPYLPEDGSVEHGGVVYPYAADFNPANLHANGGRLWLIDAAGI